MPVKTEYQQAIQSLHRLREQWKHTRVARINVLRGIMREFGVLVPLGPQTAIKTTQQTLNTLPALLQPSVQHVLNELIDIRQRIADLEKQLKSIAKKDVIIQQFMQVNRYGGVLWFNHESFDQLLNWMLTIAVVEISADPGLEPDEVAQTIVACYDIVKKLQQAEEKSEYQVVKLMEAV